MVSIAGGCDEYTPWTAALVAALAGPLYLLISHTLVRFKIDDPVDAVAVHCGSGQNIPGCHGMRFYFFK